MFKNRTLLKFSRAAQVELILSTISVARALHFGRMPKSKTLVNGRRPMISSTTAVMPRIMSTLLWSPMLLVPEKNGTVLPRKKQRQQQLCYQS